MVTVVLLKDAATYAQYCNETGHHSNTSRAHYLPTSHCVACYRDNHDEYLNIIVHEATHALVDAKAPFTAMRKNLWLSEGLSEYFGFDGELPSAKQLAVIHASRALAKLGGGTPEWAGGLLAMKDLLGYRSNAKSKKSNLNLSASEIDEIERISTWLRDTAGVDVNRALEQGAEGKLQRIRVKAIYAQSRLLVWFMLHWHHQKYRAEFSEWVEHELGTGSFNSPLFNRPSFIQRFGKARMDELECEFLFFALVYVHGDRHFQSAWARLKRSE
jgi:hypothetical protein